MIVDSHVHIFPPEIRDHRQRLFDREPAFRLLYENPKSRLVGASDLIAVMDAQGIDRAVVFGFPWRDSGTAVLNNNYILEAVARHPDRLWGFCCLDPGAEQAAAEVERCLQAGLSGVGELAFYEAGIGEGALDRLTPLMDLCSRYERPVMIHTNEPVGHGYPGKTPNTLAQIYALVRRFPRNRIILAHWGGGLFFYALLKREVHEALANVWFDTAASPFLYDPRVYRYAADLVGADRILLGSDFPLLEPRRYVQEIQAAGLNADERRRVCGENAAGLLGGDRSKA